MTTATNLPNCPDCLMNDAVAHNPIRDGVTPQAFVCDACGVAFDPPAAASNERCEGCGRRLVDATDDGAFPGELECPACDD